MKKRFMLACRWAFCIGLLFFACRKPATKTEGESPGRPGNLISVQEARSWLQQEQGNGNARSAALDNPTGEPVWDRNYPVDLGNGENILKVAMEGHFVSYGYRDMLFTKESDGLMRAAILEVRADSAYLAKKLGQKGHPEMGLRYFVDNDDFSGYLLVYSLKGRFLRGRQYAEGKLKYELQPKSSSSVSPISSTMRIAIENDEEGGGGPITLPEVVITAPAPTPPPPSNWVFPKPEGPQPINPPVNPYPYGGPGGGGGGGGNPYNGPSAQQLLENELKKDPTKLINCSTIAAYIKLASFKITNPVVLERLNSLNANDLNFSVQDIKDAVGTVVNMDFFAVKVTALPKINGVTVTPEQLLRHLRLGLNNYTEGTKFTPYKTEKINDTDKWNAEDPTASIVDIDIPGPDNGAVVVSESAKDHWIFTTIKAPKVGIHPVSGNRRFGIYKNNDGSYYIYTKGVDRLTDIWGQLAQNTVNIPFSQADALWVSFQNKVNDFVNKSGGSSEVMAPLKARPDWKLVQDVLTGKKSIDEFRKNGGCE